MKIMKAGRIKGKTRMSLFFMGFMSFMVRSIGILLVLAIWSIVNLMRAKRA